MPNPIHLRAHIDRLSRLAAKPSPSDIPWHNLPPRRQIQPGSDLTRTKSDRT